MQPFHDPELRFRSAPRLESERLVVRALELCDLEYFRAFFSDPEASVHVGGPMEAEDIWRRMLASSAFWPLTGIGMWAIERKDDGATIGHVGFFDFLRNCEPSIAGFPEMGWILAPEAHGKGFAGEACRTCLDWFEREFGKMPIYALISPGNDPSIKLAQNLGFVRQDDGVHRGQPQTMWLRPA